MKAIPRIQLFLFLFLSFSTFSNGPESLQKAWNLFNLNKREEAKALFLEATKSKTDQAEANLALAMIAWCQDNASEGFKYMEQFYSASENPMPYLYSLWTTSMVMNGFNGKKTKEQLDFLQKLLKDNRLNGTMRAMIFETIGLNYQASMKTKEEIAEFNKIGALENWQVLGVFENTSASGFNKDFGALAHPEPTAVFKNKVNQDVFWYKPPIERTDKWIDFTYYLPAGNSIMYAQTFIESPINQEVVMRSGCSGSLKIWVNDKLITNEIIERNCDLDIYNQTIKLNKGVNRVLVQIGESEAGNANFLIRITDEKGDNIPNLKTEARYKPYSKAEEYISKTLPFFPEVFFEQKIKENPSSFVNYILLANVYLRNDRAYEARKILKKTRELAPESTFLSGVMIEAYSRDDNTTELNKEREFIKRTDPSSYWALQMKLNEANSNQNILETELILDSIITKYGISEYTDFAKLEILGNKQKIDEVVKMAPYLTKTYPNAYKALQLEYVIEQQINKNPKAADEVLQKYLSEHYNDNIIIEQAKAHFTKGEKKEGIDKYKARIEAYPYKTGFYDDLAEQFFAMADYENALIYRKKVLEFAPSIGVYWEKMAKVQNALKNEKEAIESYKKAIAYEPTLFSAHKALRQIEKKKDLFEHFQKNNIDSLFKNAPKPEKFPNDNSLILLNDTQRIVYQEGATEERNEILVKILKQEGIETWKEYTVGFYENSQRYFIEKAEVLKKDGSILKAEINDNQIVFTGLEIGDALHVVYRLENIANGMLAQHFNDQFNFKLFFPLQNMSYSLLMPNNKEFKYKTLNTNLTPIIKNIDNFKLYKWEQKNQISIDDEMLMPPLTDAAAKLEISTMSDWKFIANWYKDLASTKSKSDFEVQEVVTKLFENQPKNLTNLQKAKLIYSYIEQNISYLSVAFMQSGLVPQKASRTLSIKLGDCKDLSTLFVAMCREVGIKANLVLVSTRDNGDNYMFLPSINFNHCIATMQIDKNTYFIELTDPKNSFGALPVSLLNANGLMIPAEGDIFEPNLFKINTNSRVKNTVVRKSDCTFQQNDLVSKVNTIKTGSLASMARHGYGTISDEEKIKNFTESISSDFANVVKVNSLKYSDLTSLSDSVNYTYSYTVKNELSDVAGMKIFQLPWSEKLSTVEFINPETREFPFLLWNLFQTEAMAESIIFTLPKGKKLLEVPQSVNLTTPFADYKMTFTYKEGKLLASRNLVIKKDIVDPKDYSVFREFFNKIAETDSRKYAFK